MLTRTGWLAMSFGNTTLTASAVVVGTTFLAGAFLAGALLALDAALLAFFAGFLFVICFSILGWQ